MITSLGVPMRWIYCNKFALPLAPLFRRQANVQNEMYVIVHDSTMPVKWVNQFGQRKWGYCPIAIAKWRWDEQVCRWNRFGNSTLPELCRRSSCNYQFSTIAIDVIQQSAHMNVKQLPLRTNWKQLLHPHRANRGGHVIDYVPEHFELTSTSTERWAASNKLSRRPADCLDN